MLNRFKNFKIVRQLSEGISPKLRWLMYANKTEDKKSIDYISMISGVEELKSSSDERRLEAMVRQQLKEEFPNIESMKSYELLVDAVMHTIKKKQLQAMGGED